MISQDEYVKSEGKQCPICNALTFKPQACEILDGGGAVAYLHCGLCDSQWTEAYDLVGYTMEMIGGEDVDDDDNDSEPVAHKGA